MFFKISLPLFFSPVCLVKNDDILLSTNTIVRNTKMSFNTMLRVRRMASSHIRSQFFLIIFLDPPILFEIQPSTNVLPTSSRKFTTLFYLSTSSLQIVRFYISRLKTTILITLKLLLSYK